MMLSPAHSCLVLTREYYQADIAQVYRLLAKAAAAAIVALSAAYYVLIFY